jgi:hypothetical protein
MNVHFKDIWQRLYVEQHDTSTDKDYKCPMQKGYKRLPAFSVNARSNDFAHFLGLARFDGLVFRE